MHLCKLLCLGASLCWGMPAVATPAPLQPGIIQQTCTLLAHKVGRGYEMLKLAPNQRTHLPLDTKFYVDGVEVKLETALRRYAQLILRTGVNLQPGDNVSLIGNPDHMYNHHEISFAGIFEEEAYKMGARVVVRKSDSFEATVTRVQHTTDPDFLKYVPAGYQAHIAQMTSSGERWVQIVLDPDSDRYAGTALDPAKRSVMRSAYSSLQRTLGEMQMRNEFPWHVALVPDWEYARALFPDPKYSDLQKLYLAWETQIKIIGLQHADPIAHWNTTNAQLAQVANNLNSLGLQKLRFVSPDQQTNLEVEIIAGCGWISCGEDITPQNGLYAGRPFMANMPSFEVYTSPHKDRTNGRVQTSRPVLLDGHVIEGLWLEFENGKVVRHGATQNAEVLDRLFEEDPSFRHIGEIALVDISSPIFQTGLVFGQTLLDENATIHLALGEAYPLKLDYLDPADYAAHGLNVSSEHQDLMFGSRTMTVIGILPDGSEVVLMTNGQFSPAITATLRRQH